MSRRRTLSGQLVHEFEASECPIYLVDDRRTIVYCNAACAAWLGVPAEELMGQTCVYGAAEEEDRSPLAAIAARLCPPPEALAGQRVQARVAAVGTDGALSFRQAEFLPLGSTADPGTIIGWIDSENDTASDNTAPPPEFSNKETTPAELHEELERFRLEFAGRYSLIRFLGMSPAAVRIRAQVALASSAQTNVLVVGPPGSGRQHIAKAIHYHHAAEKLGPLVPLACSALDPELLISTLDAFFRTARRSETPGTLLLGDVDRVARDVQIELVRLMRQELGPRVVATASGTLDPLVARDEFRADLAAMLSTLTIVVPPLAERLADLPLLAQAFLEQVNAEEKRQLSGWSPETLDLLASYAWPGNLDELASVVRQAHAQAGGTEIVPRDLPERIVLAADAERWVRRPPEPIDLQQSLARVETEMIQQALAQAKGNKSRAAELLGLSRPRLYRRLVQLGLVDANDEDASS